MTRERKEDIRLTRAKADEAEASNKYDPVIPVLRDLADEFEEPKHGGLSRKRENLTG